MENINISNNYTPMINAIVFDLDETIGYFTQLYTIWETITTVCDKLNKSVHQQLFNLLLDTFDGYLRPLIMSIFKYLKNKKTTTKTVVIMIYTNNNGPKQWTLMIKNYIHHKLKFELFDNIICAFKVDGKIIEPLRTTYQKTYSDLIRCASIPKTTKIFFIDDQYHERMKHENVYYIKIKPFTHHYSFTTILAKLKNKSIIDFIQNQCSFDETTFINKFIETYNLKYVNFLYNTDITHKPNIEHNVDISVGKQIISHLNDFFVDIIEKKQTRKKGRGKNTNKTRKKYIY